MDELEKKIATIVSELPLERKIELLYGDGNWLVRGIPEYGIRPIVLSDGPHGLRKQSDNLDDNLARESIPATCFPTASLTACSFDRDLLFELGEAIGKEAIDQKVDIVLGPGANIKRNPRCGRNFEYFSEDPILSGEMAAAFIKGVQSTGVGTSLKHYALNNQETNRMLTNAVVDLKAMNDLYLKSFEIAVKKGQPKTVMCSYNKVNGTYASDNKFLLLEKLKKEWNFSGFVMSDWGATNQLCSYKFGLDLDMPRFDDKKKYILHEIKKGRLSIADIDNSFRRVLKVSLELQLSEKNIENSYDSHFELSGKIAENCIVLAKNDGILPLEENPLDLLIIGSFAGKNMRYEGGGSSHVNPYKTHSFVDALIDNNIHHIYFDGYDENATIDYAKIKEAKVLASRAKKIILFVGTTKEMESEGYDRENLLLPDMHYRLFDAIYEANQNIITVVVSGAPVELKNIINSRAILISYLGGENSGSALERIIFGKTNPSGHLAETWPIAYSDNPLYRYFPGDRSNVYYKESIFVGYRYFDKARKPLLFPFGHGLSYTTFKLYNLNVISKAETNERKITFSVKNVGNLPGAVTVQLYIGKKDSVLIRPIKELKDFTKIYLSPNEEKEVSFVIDDDNLKVYDIKTRDFIVENGNYEFYIGQSSRDIELEGRFDVHSNDVAIDLSKILPSYYELANVSEIGDYEFEYLYQNKLPLYKDPFKKPYTLANTAYEIGQTFAGKIILKMFKKYGYDMYFAKNTPIRSLTMSQFINQKGVESIVKMANGKLISGGLTMLTKGIDRDKKK